jgi:hypothetical protein
MIYYEALRLGEKHRQKFLILVVMSLTAIA